MLSGFFRQATAIDGREAASFTSAQDPDSLGKPAKAWIGPLRDSEAVDNDSASQAPSR
ncbi:hypothetical protein [Pseudomonas sp. Pf153]|jgi:protein involved in temperature-dependent protein secretion|uniref:hypothetical protein n=1 Tax=Pseudomonas sp. Pf153 TaxID=1699309 RepID=UPI000AFAEC19|nr:hypothetical protein [Pseudomonas sp. Pf153]